ncbi:MAG: hypothetical protein H6671_18570 [Anaerolineaceae bacterium]|nr:hypothetical protein [Anaerolineaceae bacterium]
MLILKGVKSQIDIKLTAIIDGDLGKEIQVPFVATFKIPPVSEIKDVLTQIQSDEGMEDEVLMDRYLLGWKNIETADGQQVDFTPENLAAMLESRPYRKALADGLRIILLGKKEPLRKN